MVAFEQTHYLQVFSGAKSKFQFKHLEKVKLFENIPKQYGYLQKRLKIPNLFMCAILTKLNYLHVFLGEEL